MALWYFGSSEKLISTFPPTSQKIISNSVTTLRSLHITGETLNTLDMFTCVTATIQLTQYKNLFQEKQSNWKTTFPLKYTRYGLHLRMNLFSISCFTYAILILCNSLLSWILIGLPFSGIICLLKNWLLTMFTELLLLSGGKKQSDHSLK